MGESIRAGRVKLRRADESRNAHQTVTLLDAVKERELDALFGGARRDEATNHTVAAGMIHEVARG